MVELADALDSKSCGSDTVWVRLPPPAPFKDLLMASLFSIITKYLNYKTAKGEGIMRFELSRNFTSYLKGIAIVFMIIHHAFGFPEWYIDSLCYPSLSIVVPYIRQLTVICVGIFAFLTGYTYALHNVKNYKYSIKKTSAFLVNYWIVYAPLLIIAIIFCNYNFNLSVTLKEMFAIERPIMNFCWYVAFYICAMLIMPMYTKIIKINHFISDLLLAAVFVVVFDKLCPYSIVLYYIREYMPILICGYIIGKYNIFAYICDKIKNNNRKVLIVFGLLTIILSFAIQTFKTEFLTVNISAYSVPIFVLGLYLTEFYKIRILDKIILFLGKHSMNIWFVHCIFYSRATYMVFQKYAYLPKNPILVTVWILTLCSVASMLLLPIQKSMRGVLFGRDKTTKIYGRLRCCFTKKV